MGQSSFAFAQEITSRRLHLDPRHVTPQAWHPARQNILRQTILTRVLPRMAANRLVRHLPIDPTSVVEVSVEQVVEFADLVSTGAVSTLVTHIEALQSTGISMNTLLIELVSPTARRFGDLWTKDLMSSVDVSAGMCRLQSVMRTIGPNFEAGGARLRFNKRILLAPAFGEHHILGLTMVSGILPPRRLGGGVRAQTSGRRPARAGARRAFRRDWLFGSNRQGTDCGSFAGCAHPKRIVGRRCRADCRRPGVPRRYR